MLIRRRRGRFSEQLGFYGRMSRNFLSRVPEGGMLAASKKKKKPKAADLWGRGY